MKNGGYILCIDDDPMIARILERATAYSIVPFSSLIGFRAQAARYQPVAIFLDIHLATECGIELIPEMRERWPHAPILVVTSDDTSDWIGQALAAGAQDFLRKPLQIAEVRARLHVRLEEARLQGEVWELALGSVRFDRHHRIFSCGDKRIFLSLLEGKLFEVLFQYRKRICPRDILLNAAWPGVAVSDNSLEQRIAGIRKALRFVGGDAQIQSVRGKGYLLDTNDVAANHSP